MPNPFCHVELHAADLGASKKFYKALFDWKLADMKMGPDMTYTTITPGKNGTGGGMMQVSPGQPSQWLSYVLVDSVDKSLAKAKKLGATEIVPASDIPGIGAFAIFLDPGGVPLGLFQSTPRAGARAAKKPAAKPKAKKK